MFNWFRRSSKSAADARARAAARTTGACPRFPLPAPDATAFARLSAGARQLSPQAQRVLAGLPPSVDLTRSCDGFPRAIERLLDLWPDPHEFRRTLDAMLIDSRGGRQGFPFDVVRELGTLRDYYDRSVFPAHSCAWSSVDPR